MGLLWRLCQALREGPGRKIAHSKYGGSPCSWLLLRFLKSSSLFREKEVSQISMHHFYIKRLSLINGSNFLPKQTLH